MDVPFLQTKERSVSRATVKDRIRASVRASKDKVFLRGEFDRFGDYRQLSRAVRELAQDGVLVRVGHGVYCRGRPSTISGQPVPVETLVTIGLEAMRKLGVKAELGQEARELRAGISTQVPVLPIISVGKARVSRKIGFGTRSIRYES